MEKREIPLPKRSRPSNRRTHSKLSDDQESPAILMAEFVVIGGGIAGVSCAQELARIHSRKILIISSTDALKESRGIMRITEHLEEYTVFERTVPQFHMDNSFIEVVLAAVTSMDTSLKIISLSDGKSVKYQRVCVCSGAQPKLICTSFPSVVYGLRDVDSAKQLSAKLQSARAVAIIGNGGIALELAYVMTHCPVHWVVRDSFIGAAFFDASAAAFALPRTAPSGTIANTSSAGAVTSETPGDDKSRRTAAPVRVNASSTTSSVPNDAADLTAGSGGCVSSGCAVGPDWILHARPLQQLPGSSPDQHSNLQIHFNDEVVAMKLEEQATFCPVDGIHWETVEALLSDPAALQVDPSASLYKVQVLTKNGKILGCDVIVSATGVLPNTSYLDEALWRSPFDGVSIVVDRYMRTSVRGVYAAGDCCACYPGMEDLAELVKEYHDEMRHLGDVSTASHTSTQHLSEFLSRKLIASDRQHGSHWFQMKLWTQARLMGMHAAHCMSSANDPEDHSEETSGMQLLGSLQDLGSDTIFNVFSHATRFFGYKVVLVGRYNAQGLLGSDSSEIEQSIKRLVVSTADVEGETVTTMAAARLDQCTAVPNRSMEVPESAASIRDPGLLSSTALPLPKDGSVQVLVRLTPGVEYIKVVVCEGRVVGALLIGDTDLEEVMENLILNRFDVSAMGESLLDPTIDIEDYFD